jgi:uncharacterized protein HemX
MTDLSTQAVETVVETAVKAPLAAVKGFFTASKVKIIIALVAAAIAVGGFLVWQNHWLFNKAVATKVENHDQQATIQTYQTKEKVDDASAQIDEQFAQKHEKTEKEYVYVRRTSKPLPRKTATRLLLPSLLTLSMALSACTTMPGGVPDPDVPVG